MRQLLLAILLVFPLLLHAQDSDEIQRVLSMQADAWNHHNLERFMTGYWNSPQLTFFSGGKASQGLAGSPRSLSQKLPVARP